MPFVAKIKISSSDSQWFDTKKIYFELNSIKACPPSSENAKRTCQKHYFNWMSLYQIIYRYFCTQNCLMEFSACRIRGLNSPAWPSSWGYLVLTAWTSEWSENYFLNISYFIIPNMHDPVCKCLNIKWTRKWQHNTCIYFVSFKLKLYF